MYKIYHQLKPVTVIGLDVPVAIITGTGSVELEVTVK